MDGFLGVKHVKDDDEFDRRREKLELKRYTDEQLALGRWQLKSYQQGFNDGSKDIFNWLQSRGRLLDEFVNGDSTVAYPITVLQAALLALTRINVTDGRIEELKQAIKLLEAQRDLP